MKAIERRIAEVERAIDARPLVLVVSCTPLAASDLPAAIAQARRDANIAPGAPAVVFNVVTGVARS